ncbi:DnaB-like helicase N-terminal domain-containing protein [Streptomyces malaysiensis subsp. malaysiensis]|uniref:DnaB-like helicase N-terminal domain-containing protein n=1 Tax=Streptomyces malaysiensis TaxID=92644 RepID=UPI0024C0E00E|nr:DnaB-like helicase N-terminal domain-containing protein [Streptomyces sp. NA07423]WHX19805.1 DnaB-like helicase N-terminal domain-containing protein [Streptomyces sp. NA07423]
MTTAYDTTPGIPDDIGAIERIPPNDIDAEQAYFGAVLLSRKDARRVHQFLTPGDFYRPAHSIIHTAIGALLDRGEPADPITVAAELQATGHLARVGGAAYLHHLVQVMPTAANADWYAERIRDLALRRALIETGTRIAQLGYDPEAGDPAELAEHAVALTRDVRDAGRASDDAPVTDMHDFLTVQDTHDWVIPGLLERGDRLILTAGEGGGKSVLLRQIAVATAASINPLTFADNAYGPQRVLVLDCENSAPQSRRRYRDLMNAAERGRRGVKRGQLHIDVRPEGIDLTRADGRAWLMRRVETVMPDLLVIGPIYQLHTGDPNSEEHARKVTVALNEARLTARCAMVLEAHAPHASGFGPRSLRPAGSSLWLRWPEFGFGLRPVEDERSAEEDRARRLVPWRGMRDDRAFPPFLRQGERGGWPWVPYIPIDADQFTGRSATGATG